VPGLGSRFEGMKRHTTAYAPSWQASGDTAAPHRHSSEKTRPTKKAPTFQPGRPNLTLPPEPASAGGQVTAAVCGNKTGGPRQGCRTRPAARSVCSTGARHVSAGSNLFASSTSM
jgi:hypothetical protein